MGRPPCCDEIGMKKGPWTPEEDEKLLNYITKHGHGNWRSVPKLAALNRCGKSCRLRWTNYLRPDIKRGKFTDQEEQLIINLHSVLGNKWSKIATHLPGRTDNEIKNFWNTHLRKKLLQMGIDPETHKPRTDLKHLINLSHMLGNGISNNNNNNTNLMMNPLPHSALGSLLQQPDVSQLAQINLLLNLLQLMNNGNTYSLVNNMDNSSGSALSTLLGNQNLFNKYNNNIPLESYGIGSPANLFPPPQPITQNSQQLDDVSKSWADIEGFDFDFGNDNNNNNNNNGVTISNNSSTSSPEAENEMNTTNNEAENRLASLVMNSSVVSSSFNQMDQVSTHSPSSSSIFDAWDKLLEDDTTDSYWQQILELTSTTSESPASW